ncbi:hypothetical protein ACET3X_009883 [Alternaria dauci]|uniref:Uncharacterized protein n=1 Tax=Alternaria dauci TaxID=48095 RepID=A0ABR3U7K7_9PLEO
MLRGATADTETVVGDEEIRTREVDSRLQNAIAMACQDEMQYEYEDENAAGPSGTYINPLRQDSVIPNDTQMQKDMREDDTATDAYNDAIIRSLISDSSHDTRQNRTYRLELTRLLISYLDGINEFDSTSYDFAAEERMNFLLHHFQCAETEIWHTNHSDSAIRLDLTLERWMTMRHRLSAFRNATGYFGPPGQQWEEFLRGLDNAPHAKAILAFVELKDDGELEDGKGIGAGNGFNADLMVVFDGLTRIKGCNGPDAFKGVKRFNEGLWKWFDGCEEN